MNETQRKRLAAETPCEIRYDELTRQLFATDASIYQIVPEAVAFPASREETAAVIKTAISEGIAVIPRGAGTGLAGGAVGSGLVVDLSRYNHAITDFDAEKETVRVEPGVVLDRLNAFLKPHGRCFGPDVATSSRATLGGMIANNSSGARAPLYGTTVDHVVSLDVALTDGRIASIGPGHDDLPELTSEIDSLLRDHAGAVDAAAPGELVKHWAGYGFDQWLRKSADLTKIVVGSEGTLATIVSAELKVSPLPRSKSVGALFFDSVAEAMAATVAVLDLDPVAVEHVDRVLFDQTRGQLAFKRARALLALDELPCEAILFVEFFDDDGGRMDTLMGRRIGTRRASFTEIQDMEAIWSLRKAGLSLLTGCKGASKPAAGIEDTAVRPEQLPDYVAGLQGLLASLGLEASFYGHAASGLLHVRPVVDLHRAEDVAKYRQLAVEVSALVKQFKGSIAAEHGVGIARTEFLAEHLGPELVEVAKRVKALFDPSGLMNPGKIVADGRFRIDGNLRQGSGSNVSLPFEPELAFASKDESFIGNLEQCNGCGGCLKELPTMCPTFVATGEEVMSTRGRANTIRAALESRLSSGVLDSPDLDAAMESCLSCKACTMECPSNVNMALLKAELLHARQRSRGLSIGERMLSRVDLLGRIASLWPGAANAVLGSGLGRSLLAAAAGLSTKRPIPRYSPQRFDRWFSAHEPSGSGDRGEVILWDDCFVRYNEPEIGVAAVKVLEGAGYRVVLPTGRACCGRPAFSVGRLDLAREMASRNVALLTTAGDARPIVFLEPSCFSMFYEDYRELNVAGADALTGRSFLFEQFLDDLLERTPGALSFSGDAAEVAVHTHCHAKSLTDAAVSASLLNRVDGVSARLLETGCCGMAGAFGAKDSTYELSLKVAKPFIELLDGLDERTAIVASGTSCRHQIEHLSGAEPLHMAEFLADALD